MEQFSHLLENVSFHDSYLYTPSDRPALFLDKEHLYTYLETQRNMIKYPYWENPKQSGNLCSEKLLFWTVQLLWAVMLIWTVLL